jgi:hypothetical protein
LIQFKNCTTCHYYIEFKTKDILNPDKTITKGKVVQRHCKRGAFDLVDLSPCELYERCDNPSARIPLPPLPLKSK